MSAPATLLVIGRAGQVARCLARQAPVGLAVVARGREDGLDIATGAGLAAHMDAVRPTVVVNAAAYTAVDRAEGEPELAFAVNRDGPARLSALCAAQGVPLVHISTDYVFDGQKAAPYAEDDPIRPLGVYGASKAAGEAVIRERMSEHLILRTSWVYSPFGTNFVRTMLKLGAARDEIGIVDDQHGAPTSADDIAAAILAIVARLGGQRSRVPFGTYHMTAAGETTWCGFAREVFRLAGQRGGSVPELRPITTAEYPTPAERPQNSRLDCSRLKQAFDISLPDWRTGVARCLEELMPRPEGSGP